MTHSTVSSEPTLDATRTAAERRGAGASGSRDPVAGPTVVVGYDGSIEARAAFTAALDRAGADGHVIAVHVTAPTSTWWGTPYYDKSVEDRLRAGETVLDELRDEVEDTDASVELELMEGHPADVLMRVAAVRDADEIVVGSRGLGRFRAALGSVSQALVRAADRPVVVVPGAAASVDGAELSRR